MSSLLLSQSIISSAENSIREKSFQRFHPHHFGHQSNRSHLSSFNRQPLPVSGLVADRRIRDAKNFPKFCWLVFISILVLIFYLFVFTLVALIGYVLFIWIPSDIERNKLNNELYSTIVDRSNILMIGQLPQYEKKFLLTRDLFMYESSIDDDLMNLVTKPIPLQTKYPALFWNEDFKSMVGNERTRGAVWLNVFGETIFDFMMPLNATMLRMIRFEPAKNHIKVETRFFNGKWILPISSQEIGSELELVLTNDGLIKVFINQIDQNRFLCIGSPKTKRIDTENGFENHNCLPEVAFNENWSFVTGFKNGTNLHLFDDQNKVLVVSENVLYIPGKQYEYEMIDVRKIIVNGLIPIIADYVLFGLASLILLILIITVVKYFIFERDSEEKRARDRSEYQPIYEEPSDYEESLKSPPSWLNLFNCCCSCCSKKSNKSNRHRQDDDEDNDNNIDNNQRSNKSERSSEKKRKNYDEI